MNRILESTLAGALIAPARRIGLVRRVGTWLAHALAGCGYLNGLKIKK